MGRPCDMQYMIGSFYQNRLKKHRTITSTLGGIK